MFKRLSRGIKRAILFFLVLGAIGVAVITLTNLFGDRLFAPGITKIWIDSDSGNEIDDLYAISRALSAPEIEVTGLSSAHWEFHPEADGQTLKESQELNTRLLKLFGRDDIPHPSGAPDMLRFWDEPVPNPSAAAEQIIARVKGLPKKEKLNVVSLGALTNIASAILIDPDIVPRIRLYSLVMKYDPKTRVWNKNEFNARNDLDALDIVLNSEGLEMYIMTATASRELVFTKEETDRYLKGKKGPWDFLVGKWEEKFPGSDEWIMWDVALIEAIINPDLARAEKVLTPPENKQHTITVYTRINKELMKADYFSTVNRKN